MTMWVFVAIAGGLLSIVGFYRLVRRYRQGDIRARYLVAIGVGYVALVAYLLLSTVKPMLLDSRATIALLLLPLVAIVVIVREHQNKARTDGSSE